MKKTLAKDMLLEYDFSTGLRDKYATRIAKGSNLVVLDRDVHELFPDSAAVNDALRALAKVVAMTNRAKTRAARLKAAARKRAAG